MSALPVRNPLWEAYEWSGDRLVVNIAGLGEFRMTPAQIRQFAFELLAELDMFYREKGVTRDG